jgi:hypothetical protein
MCENPLVIRPAPELFWKTLQKAVKAVRRNARLFRAANSPARMVRWHEPGAAVFTGSYFISTDRGVFVLERGELFQLTQQETYGMAVRQGRFYLAISSDDYSCICSSSLPERLREGTVLELKEHHRVPIHKGGRVHQIAFYRNHLALAETASNCITFMDVTTGQLAGRWYPFRDQFGRAIKGDHNHINSVSECGDCLLFCAYKAGEAAMIGVIEGGRVMGYRAPNLGAHDVHITGDTLYYSDTFGATFAGGDSECGYLMANGMAVDEEFFSIPPGFAIRGVCQQGEEMLLGHSHKGSRAKRFSGNGSLFRLVNGRVVHAMKAPFAQVYDIIGTDGRHFDEPARPQTWEEVNGLLESVLGPPVYEDEVIVEAEGRRGAVSAVVKEAALA